MIGDFYSCFHPVRGLKPLKHPGAASPPPHPPSVYRVEVSCCGASEGSVAVGSCDHRGPGASGRLPELGDLQGDVYQGGQHHLHAPHKHKQRLTSCFLTAEPCTRAQRLVNSQLDTDKLGRGPAAFEASERPKSEPVRKSNQPGAKHMTREPASRLSVRLQFSNNIILLISCQHPIRLFQFNLGCGPLSCPAPPPCQHQLDRLYSRFNKLFLPMVPVRGEDQLQ